MTNAVIVSHSSMGRENYCLSQLNLIKSCVKSGWSGDYLMTSTDGYVDEYLGVPIKIGGWPVTNKYGTSWQHADMPYQFKPFAIYSAYEKGYKFVIWADSTVRMVNDPDQWFCDKAREKGVMVWDNLGFPLASWISDTAMKNLGENEESIKGIPQIMACFMVFDFNNPVAVDFLERWMQSALDNSFYPDNTSREGFIAPRHDQSTASAILYRMGVEFLEYGEGFCYQEGIDKPELIKGRKQYFVNKGIEL